MVRTTSEITTFIMSGPFLIWCQTQKLPGGRVRAAAKGYLPSGHLCVNSSHTARNEERQSCLDLFVVMAILDESED
jgi:hypothetical protein